MFLGRYYHSLEDKGRLAIPAPFRRLLGTKPILTRGLDGCLFLFSQAAWQKLITNLNTSPLAGADTRTLTRLFAHDALEVTYDPQGRALVSRELRDFAGLKKQVIIAGSVTWVEIWDQALYHQHLKNATRTIDHIAQRLSRITNSHE